MTKDASGGKGRLFVISAPSGCGKTTLCRRLLDDNIGLIRSISVTTRPPRKGERDGLDYRFVSKKDFEDMAARKEFLEYEDNFGHLYGTPRSAVEKSLKEGRPVLLSIDVKGAMSVKKAYPKNSTLIFIIPPSEEELKRRLLSRMSDADDQISKRLELAEKEMAEKDRYDYTVVNDNIEKAYQKLKNIVISKIKNSL